MIAQLRTPLMGALMIMTLISTKVAFAGERGGNGAILNPSLTPSLSCQKRNIVQSPIAKLFCTDDRGYEFRVSIHQNVKGRLDPISDREFKLSCSFFKMHEFSGTHKSVKVSSGYIKGKNRCILKSAGKGEVEFTATKIVIKEM